MWIRQTLLALVGLSAGVTVAGGLFSFIIGLGIGSELADRTHTAKHVLLYEDCVAVGGVLGNLMYIYHIALPMGTILLACFGLFAGIFVGCWAMALTEALDVIPIFMRRIKLTRYLSWFILGIAMGKGLGSLLFFWQRW